MQFTWGKIQDPLWSWQSILDMERGGASVISDDELHWPGVVGRVGAELFLVAFAKGAHSPTQPAPWRSVNTKSRSSFTSNCTNPTPDKTTWMPIFSHPNSLKIFIYNFAVLHCALLIECLDLPLAAVNAIAALSFIYLALKFVREIPPIKTTGKF